MQASILDLRYKMKDVLAAIEHGEVVTITYRGKAKAVLKPIGNGQDKKTDLADHPFFGMDQDEGDTSLDKLRGGRFDDL